MRKRILCWLLCISVAAPCLSVKGDERYTIIKVIGTILLKKNGNALSQGDVIASTEPVVFKTPDAKAAVISSEKGRFVLSSSGNLQGGNFKSNLIPPMSNISSRSGPILSVPDVKNYFSGKCVLLDHAFVTISPEAFAMHDSGFFYLTFEHNGEKINKKLSHRADTLIINRDEVFKIDNQAIPHGEQTPVKLYYLDKKKAVYLSDLVLITPSEKELENEISALTGHMKDKPEADRIQEITSYISEFYGKVDEIGLNRWLNRKFGYKF